MTVSERLAFIATLDAKGAIQGFNQIGKSAETNLKQAETRIDKVGAGLTKFGAGAVGVAGLAGTALFAAGQKASDLGESINAVNVTFGDAADGILELGENAAQSVGLSNASFNSLAVQFSSFATTVAGKGGDVTQVIDDMTHRAADFASVMNLDVAEAASIFQSGLAGETEPLKKFGIDLSAAAVEAHAYAKGIADAGETMTEAQKVQARYSLLMEQTAKTQGDFANTADSAANAQRIAAAEMENAAASLGSVVLPIMAKVAGTAADLAGAFTKANDATGGLLGQIAGFATVGIGAVGAISLITGQAIKMRNAFTTVDATTQVRSLNGLGKAAKFAAPALGFAGAAMIGMSIEAGKAQKRTEELAASMSKLSTVADEEFSAAFNEAMFNSLLNMTLNGKDLDETFRELAASSLDAAQRSLEYAEANGVSQVIVDKLTEAIRLEAAAQKEAAERAREKAAAEAEAAQATEANTAAGEAWRKHVIDAFGDAESAAKKWGQHVRDAFGDAADAAEDQEAAFEGLKDTLGEAADNALDLVGAFDVLSGTSVSLEEATRAVWDGMRSLEEQVAAAKEENDQFATSLDVSTQTGSDNRAAIQAQVEAYQAHAAAALADGQSLETVTGHLNANRQSLIDNLVQMGFNREEATAYIDTLGLTPENITTAVAIVGTGEVVTKINEIVTGLGTINAGAVARIQALVDQGELDRALALARALERIKAGTQRNSYRGQNDPPTATGHDNVPAGWRTVGEQGRELVFFRGGETVLNNANTNKVLGAMSRAPSMSRTIHIGQVVNNNYSDEAGFIQRLNMLVV